MTPRLRSTSSVLVAFVVAFGVYAASVRGDVSLWDTGDLQTVPYILGIPYPTGFPGFVLIGWVWSHALPFGMVAVRMNLLAAFASAVTVAALVAALLACGVAELVALGAAAVYAFGRVVWEHATYVDVHPISFAAVALALVFALRWDRDGRARDAAAALAAATAGLAIDNTTVLALPGLVLVAVGRRPPLGAVFRASAVAAVALAAAYAYLPLRSAYVTARRLDPTLALGIPPGRPFWDDGHPASLAGFVRVVGGTRFAPQGALAGMLGPAALHHVAADFVPDALRDLREPVLWLALVGAVLWLWRAPRVAAGVVALGAVPLLWVFAYPSESDAARYYFGAYLALTLLAAYGANAFGALPPAARASTALAGTLLVVAAAATDLSASAPFFSQPTDPGASPFVSRVTLLSPPDAVLVAPWLYATSLGYAAYVERRLGRRIVVTADPDEYLAHYRTWLRSRPVVVISDDELRFPGFTAHELDHGSPHLYALR